VVEKRLPQEQYIFVDFRAGRKNLEERRRGKEPRRKSQSIGKSEKILKMEILARELLDNEGNNENG